jgi:dTDP-4-amino-4,6-dideoxygalactose transaminase
MRGPAAADASAGRPYNIRAARHRLGAASGKVPDLSQPITTGHAIPFTIPSFEGREREYVLEVMSGGRTSGDGPFTHRCHQWLEGTLDVRKALLTTSCTHALEMAALLLQVKAGDEVIVPSFTFVSTANAFVLRGARPVFADIRPDTLNIDEQRLEALITDRTAAIVVVHYAGVGCEMQTILEIAGRHGIRVVEDAAQAIHGRYHGRPLGSLGALGTLSFHETKNISCGEGGAILINDLQFADRAEILREKGTDRSRFFRGQVDKYTWVDVGSSYLPSEILAAILYGQLEVADTIQQRRSRIWDRYHAELAGWARASSVVQPSVPVECDHPSHMYYLRLPTLDHRQRFIQHLADRSITATFHYPPLHLSGMGLQYGGRTGDCPVTESVSDTLVRLPLYNCLGEDDLDRVIEAVVSFPV